MSSDEDVREDLELSEDEAGEVAGGDTSIGSATSGAGAGKAKLGEFTITKNTDTSSP